MTKVFSDHCGPKGDKGDTGPPGVAGSPGLSAIGTPITASIANAILFADASGNLAQDAGLTFGRDGPDQLLVEASLAGENVLIASGNLSGLAGSGGELQSYSDNATVRMTAFSSADGSDAVLEVNSGFSNYLRLLITGGGVRAISGNLGNYVELASADLGVTLPSLAGTGTRAVVVDANGKLSAP